MHTHKDILHSTVFATHDGRILIQFTKWLHPQKHLKITTPRFSDLKQKCFQTKSNLIQIENSKNNWWDEINIIYMEIWEKRRQRSCGFSSNSYNKIMVLSLLNRIHDGVKHIYMFNISMIFVQYDLSIERTAGQIALSSSFFSILIQKFYNPLVNPWWIVHFW